MMNRISNLLTIYIASVVLISCGPSDDSGAIELNESDLIGTWELVEHKIMESSTVQSNGVTQNCEYSAIGFDYAAYRITVSENPKKISSSGSYRVRTLLDCNGVIVEDVEDFINSNNGQEEGFHVGDWKIENGNLVNTFVEIEGGEPTSITSGIVELSDDKLVLTWKRDDSDSLINLPVEGIDVNIVETSNVFTYVRKN